MFILPTHVDAWDGYAAALKHHVDGQPLPTMPAGGNIPAAVQLLDHTTHGSFRLLVAAFVAAMCGKVRLLWHMYEALGELHPPVPATEEAIKSHANPTNHLSFYYVNEGKIKTMLTSSDDDTQEAVTACKKKVVTPRARRPSPDPSSHPPPTHSARAPRRSGAPRATCLRSASTAAAARAAMPLYPRVRQTGGRRRGGGSCEPPPPSPCRPPRRLRLCRPLFGHARR